MGLGTQVYNPLGQNNPDVFELDCLVTYDGSGVPSVVAGKSIASCSDDGTGLFTLTTAFSWQYLVGAGFVALSASATGAGLEVVSRSSTGKTIAFRATNAAGAAADPANGDGFFITLKFQRSGLSVT